MNKIIKLISELVFPSHLYCICCGSIIDSTRKYGLCDNCIEKIHWVGNRTCRKCGKILSENYFHDLCFDCRTHQRSFDKGYTCMRYSLYERQIISDFKFNGRDYLSGCFGSVLADRMSYEDENIDIITFVPAHPEKEKKRGYNQAELIAKEFASLYKPESVPSMKLLVRTKKTLPMKALEKSDRFFNVSGAFSVAPGCESFIEGKTVALIDDIFTTGSTVNECAETLKKSGASKVVVITLAAGNNFPPDSEL